MKRWITLGMVILLVLPCTQTSFASARKKKTVATETKKEPTKRQSKYDKLVKNKSCESEGVIEAEIFPDREYAQNTGIADIRPALQHVLIRPAPTKCCCQ